MCVCVCVRPVAHRGVAGAARGDRSGVDGAHGLPRHRSGQCTNSSPGLDRVRVPSSAGPGPFLRSHPSGRPGAPARACRAGCKGSGLGACPGPCLWPRTAETVSDPGDKCREYKLCPSSKAGDQDPALFPFAGTFRVSRDPHSSVRRASVPPTPLLSIDGFLNTPIRRSLEATSC